MLSSRGGFITIVMRITEKQSHQIKSFAVYLKNRQKHYQSANRASSGASQVSLHICRVSLEPLSVWKTTKSMPIDRIISL